MRIEEEIVGATPASGRATVIPLPTVQAPGGAPNLLESALPEVIRRRHRWRPKYVAALLFADMLAAVVASGAAYFSRSVDPAPLAFFGHDVGYLALGVVTVAVWPIVLFAAGAYRAVHLRISARDLTVPVVAALWLVGGVAIASFAFKDGLSRLIVVVYLPVLIGTVLLLRGTVHFGLAAAHKRGRARTRLLVVGEREQIGRFVNLLVWQPNNGYDVVGICSPGSAPSIRVRGRDFGVMGPPDDLVAVARRMGVDAVAVANPAGFESMTIQKAAWELERSGVDLLVAPDVVPVAGPRVRFVPMSGLPLLHIDEPRTESLMRSLHGHTSRLIAVPLAILLAPVLAVIALAVLIGSGRPVFYRQNRVGYRGREFPMLKFRTMVTGAEDLLADLQDLNEYDGALFKIKEDPRVTRVGRFLRRHSLDELPQIFNVLKGEMALIGPRPCLMSETTKFGEAEMRRFLVKPGMTGLWQVRGRGDLDWEDYVFLDLYYVDSWSPMLDLSILWRTLMVVVRGTGC